MIINCYLFFAKIYKKHGKWIISQPVVNIEEQNGIKQKIKQVLTIYNFYMQINSVMYSLIFINTYFIVDMINLTCMLQIFGKKYVLINIIYSFGAFSRSNIFLFYPPPPVITLKPLT